MKWEGKKEDQFYKLITENGDEFLFYNRFQKGHNISNFLPDNLIPSVGTIVNNSRGCATSHIPEGYITFYKLKGGYSSCVPKYTFAYGTAELYTCKPAKDFIMIGSMKSMEFLKIAEYQGKKIVCGGTHTIWEVSE